MLCIFSVVLGLSAYFARKPLLHLIGASENTYHYADDYLSVYLIGTLFVQLSVGLNTFLTAQGKSGMAMLGVGIGAILNIALDPIFIFVFHLGIKGAAIATVIGQWVAMVITLLAVMKKYSLKGTYKLDPGPTPIYFFGFAVMIPLGIIGFVVISKDLIKYRREEKEGRILLFYCADV